MKNCIDCVYCMSHYHFLSNDKIYLTCELTNEVITDEWEQAAECEEYETGDE